ncbi:hypothetical protein CsSME_00024972 [Camellia sinensis var. sinensis]
MEKVEFVVYCNSTEYEIQCMCWWFKFRGIMCTHSFKLATNDDGKHEVIQLGLKEIKDRVRKETSGCTSNVPRSSSVPPSTTVPPSNISPKSSPGRSTTKASMVCRVLSSLVARRRGLDEIVNRLKGKNKKATNAQVKFSFRMQDTVYHPVCILIIILILFVPQSHSYYFPCMDGTQESMYVLVCRGYPMQMVDNSESTSHTQAGMNISSQSFICVGYNL